MGTLKSYTQAAQALGLLLTLQACSGDEKKSPADEGTANDGDPVNEQDGADGGPGDGERPDPNEPAAPGVPPTFAPTFPGAGTSGDDAPLTNGMLCDYEPANGAPTPNEITTCYFGPGSNTPAATLEQVLECVDGSDSVHIRLTFNPDFVDNTYGAGAIGWSRRRSHTFEDLYKSDHAEVLLTDEDGAVVMQFKIDYLSEDPSALSGYGTLGVSGGDGNVTLGDPAWVLATSTSMHKNLNERGYESYTVDSPLTDTDYTPSADAPEWDYRVVYEAWVDVSAFADVGFGGATIEYVHASPAKGEDTIEVMPGECPPENCVGGPDEYCGQQPPPPDGDAACSAAPDEYCGETPYTPPDAGPEPLDCNETPDDPRCIVE